MSSDNAEYTPDSGAAIDVAPRGSAGQETARDAVFEDKETAQSESTGRIPQREVDDLRANHFPGETQVQGRTRGVKNDAFKPERDVDRALDERGITDAEQDVEFGSATSA